MAKLTLSDIDNESVPSASTTVNANNDAVESAIENTLSRDGTSPNQMEANLDLNSYRILNHAAARGPTFTTDLIRVGDLADLVAVLGVQGPEGPTGDGSGDMLAENNLSELTNTTTARSNLGLVIGTDVLEFNADLQAISDLTWTANGSLVWRNASGTISQLDLSSDVEALIQTASDSAFRTELGLGGSATLDVGSSSGTVAAGDDSRFSELKINTVNSTANLLSSWAGTLLRHTSTSTHNYIITPNSTIDHEIGTVIQIRNAVGAGNITIQRGSGVTLYLAGSATNGNLTLAGGGLCTLVQEATDVWVATGAGLS